MIPLLLACAGDEGEPPPVGPDPTVTVGVLASASVSIPTTAAPLVRALHVEADEPVTVEARWSSGDHEVRVAFDGAAEVHDRLLLGWRPGRTYDLTVTATAADGSAATFLIEVMTEPSPAHFPSSTVRRVAGDRQPGHTLIPMRAIDGALPRELAMVFDEDGELCFWLDVRAVLITALEIDGGLMTIQGVNPAMVVRYGWDGIERARYALGPSSGDATLVDPSVAETFHHDVIELPGDERRYLALARAPISVPDYPSDYADPAATGPRRVADDVIVEFLADGTVVNELRMSEVLPVRRIGFDSLGTTVDGWADWAHANAILWDDGDYVVSLRHQDAILKLAPDGAVEWILGYPENWPAVLAARRLRPLGELQWPYHAHAPRFGPDGPLGERTLLLFDNGNHQTSPWSGIPPVTDPAALRSRVVQFSIDEEAGTVRQDWAFERPAGGQLYSPAVGDATVMDNGHVLSVWGFLDRLPDGTTNEAVGLGVHSVRVIELDRDSVSEVEELYLWTDRESGPRGWTGYRAQRIPSLEGRVVD